MIYLGTMILAFVGITRILESLGVHKNVKQQSTTERGGYGYVPYGDHNK